MKDCLACLSTFELIMIDKSYDSTLISINIKFFKQVSLYKAERFQFKVLNEVI